jgi:glyoxylase-like metal-dependent hydrolase (beta-lactamase superfamily II)
MAVLPDKQIAPVYHRRIGDIVITALSDGVAVRTHEMMRNVSEADAADYLARAFRTQFVLSINAFLVRTPTQTILIDTGSGTYLGPDAGHLMGNLATAGVSPETIDAVLLTHMHPDHSAGLADRETGQAHFPNAELVVHEAEFTHWFDEAAMARASAREKALMFQQAREQTAPYADRTRRFTSGEVAPGITALPLPGHTPGHTGFLIESGGQSLLIWGDIVHMPEVQVPNPAVAMVVDVDPALAAETRAKVFDRVATDRVLVTGMHLHFPGFGHLARDGESYRFVPEPWQQTLG